MMNDWAIPEPDKEDRLVWEPRAIPNLKAKTWYRINGDLKSKTPIVVVHGGPGAGHNYLLSLLDLLRTGHPVVFYDQTGCGTSEEFTDDKFKPLWVHETSVEELQHLCDHLKLSKVILAGQSWGAYIAADYAVQRPDMVEGLMLLDGMVDGKDGAGAMRASLKELPEEIQRVIKDCEAGGDHGSKEYEQAVQVFFKRFVVDLEDTTPEVLVNIENLMASHVEFTVNGNLRTATLYNYLKFIACPVLQIWGDFDELKYNQSVITDHLVNAKVTTVELKGAKHFPHLQARAEFMSIVEKWMHNV